MRAVMRGSRHVVYATPLAAGGIRCRRTWYGMKLIGAEPALVGALADLAGEIGFGRLRPRYSRR